MKTLRRVSEWAYRLKTFVCNAYHFRKELADIEWFDGIGSILLLQRHVRMMSENWWMSDNEDRTNQITLLCNYKLALDRLKLNKYAETQIEAFKSCWGAKILIKNDGENGERTSKWTYQNAHTEEDIKQADLELETIRQLRIVSRERDKQYVADHLWDIADLFS